jgi:predicted transcriptional regulator of viral defense system
MAKQLNWPAVERTLRQNRLMLFSPQDLRHLLDTSEISIRFLLTRAQKRGDVLKLRRELYALLDRIPSELAIANALLKPSYLSFHYAMAYYHLIPEAVYQVSSATTRATRRFQIAGRDYSYHHLKSSVFAGYKPERVGDQTVLIAEPEKALLDTLYLATLRLLAPPERLDPSGLDWKRVLELEQLYKRPNLMAALQEYR